LLSDVRAAFPNLEVIELIGQGGMGFVFKARQSKLDRFVALKLLPASLAADPAFADRFTREARFLARLNHPNIVTIHDFGQANEFFFLLMEFVDGVNLRQAMEVGRFTPEQALSIVPRICDALQFAHNEGILHRDIKPENILLDSKERVKIADFGIAKIVGTEKTTTSDPLQKPENLSVTGVIGTPNYMAPEQIEHPRSVDQRADIYSLGVVFYEMLTGELPLGCFAPPSQKSAADPRLDEVVLRTLEKEPRHRTSTASEVKTQVESISQSPPKEPTSALDDKRSAHGFLSVLFGRGLKAGVITLVLFIAGVIIVTAIWPTMSGAKVPAPGIAEPTKQPDEAAQIKLKFAEQQVKEAEAKQAIGMISPLELQQAIAARDVMLAEIKGDSIEVARIKLRIAEMELNVATKKRANGVADSDEYAKAQLTRDLAAAYLKQAEARKTK
jgi:serine/threonine protein kinase